MRLNIFRAGEHPDLTAEAVQQAIADYDPALHQAPLTIGHVNSSKAPAWGWLQSLQFAEPEVAGEFADIDPDFAELWNRGNYRKISAAFYPPGHKDNPLKRVGKDGFYLHHVAALGAKPPAIKGLQNPEKFETALAFEEDIDGLVIAEFAETSDWPLARVFRGLREYLIETAGVEKADTILPEMLIEEATWAAMRPMPAELEMFSEELTVNPDDRSIELDQREAALRDREAALNRQEFAQFAEAELGKKLHPASRQQVVELLMFMQSAQADELLTFGEGTNATQLSPVETLKAVLKTLPDMTQFSESAGADQPLTFAEDPIALANAARNYVAEQAAKGITVSPSEAVRHLASR